MKAVCLRKPFNMVCIVATWFCMGCRSPVIESNPPADDCDSSTIEFSGRELNPATPATNDYDAAFIAKVQQRWYAILSSKPHRDYKPGKVRLVFSLHSDGSLSDITMVESTVSKLFSQFAEDAVKGAAPYQKWPEPMREEVGKDVREIIFRFCYR
jgi:outer membrane biosynthesis protein TonB